MRSLTYNEKLRSAVIVNIISLSKKLNKNLLVKDYVDYSSKDLEKLRDDLIVEYNQKLKNEI